MTNLIDLLENNGVGFTIGYYHSFKKFISPNFISGNEKMTINFSIDNKSLGQYYLVVEGTNSKEGKIYGLLLNPKTDRLLEIRGKKIKITLTQFKDHSNHIGSFFAMCDACGKPSEFPIEKTILDENISLGLSENTVKMLTPEIQTYGDLVEKTAEELLKMHGFGIKKLGEVRAELAKRGLALKGE